MDKTVLITRLSCFGLYFLGEKVTQAWQFSLDRTYLVTLESLERQRSNFKYNVKIGVQYFFLNFSMRLIP